MIAPLIKLPRMSCAARARAIPANTCTCEERCNIDLKFGENEEKRHKPDQVFCNNLKDRDKPIIKIGFCLFCDTVGIGVDEIIGENRGNPGAKDNKYRIDQLVSYQPGKGRGDNIVAGQGNIERNSR